MAKQIEHWGHPSGSTLVVIETPDAHGRCRIHLKTDFSKSFGLLKPEELIVLAHEILAEYGCDRA